MNPVSIVLGLATKIYGGGAELLFGGRRVALSLNPQIAVAGEDNSFGVPDGALGLALLVGARISFGEYLSGTYFQPRIGPLHWSGSGWSFWAYGIELETGYTIPLYRKDASVVVMAHAGGGLRILLPAADRLSLPSEDGRMRLEIPLSLMVAPLLNLSVGVGWW